ncbi:hypothetical protein B0H10DRAFT_1802175 [Mycena sp. CBHHK59/15]|nr:hypothetical protein B0H10DRAFT_1802175 [Mycena sp. CBHHK59/15]
MKAKQTPEEKIRALYGDVYLDTPATAVYTDSSCYNNGKGDARAGAGVFWGENNPYNQALCVPGPLQSNNRGEIYAVLRAVLHADPRRGINETRHVDEHSRSTRTRVIRNMCYWAGTNADLGWKCINNGDILRDMVKLLAGRLAPTRFAWIAAHTGNVRGDILL